MKQFRSVDDLNQVSANHPAFDVLNELVVGFMEDSSEYDPEADGHVILVEEDDIHKPLIEVWPDTEFTLDKVPWEGFSKLDDCVVGIYLANNQYGLLFVIHESVMDQAMWDVVAES